MKTIATLADLATPGFGMDFLTDVDTLQVHNRSYTREEDEFGTMERVYKPHLWWTHTSTQFRLHPVVKTIVTQYNVRPADWHLLMLEWPHVSVDDDSQLAYTRTEEAGVDFMDNGSKRQTKTSIGKYVARHWPHVPDHIRRDWVGTFSPSTFEIWEGVENIIAGIELGPQSCMKASYGTIPFNAYEDNAALLKYRAGKIPKEDVDWESHPYIVYQPQYGWAMAVRLDKGKPDIVMGRCLVQLQDKVFVRSYKRGDTDSDYSHTDEKLEHWLKGQGFQKEGGWDGYKLAIFDHPNGGWMGPYLDGCTQNVKHCGEYLQIDEYGSYQSDDTDGQLQGSAEDEESIGDCDHCGSSVPEGDCDHIWVGRDEDMLVCGDCTHHYTHVTGDDPNGSTTEYYVRNRYAVSVGNTDYDKNNLPSYIYCLADDEYAHKDHCVCCVDGDYRMTTDCVCDEDGEWHEEDSDDIIKIGCLYYKKDSDDIVCPEDDPDEWHEKEKCWESVSGKWFTEEQPQIEIDVEGTYAASELQDMIDNA